MPRTRIKNKKSLCYVVRMGTGYYSRGHHWWRVPKEQATRLSLAQARRIRDKLKDFGIREVFTVERA